MALDFPGSPIEGQIYLASNGISYQWQTDKWATVMVASYANTGSNPGETPPGAPTNGTFWWDSENGQLYTWYEDADSAQWITASPNTIVDSSGTFTSLGFTPDPPLPGVNVVSTEHGEGE